MVVVAEAFTSGYINITSSPSVSQLCRFISYDVCVCKLPRWAGATGNMALLTRAQRGTTVSGRSPLRWSLHGSASALR